MSRQVINNALRKELQQMSPGSGLLWVSPSTPPRHDYSSMNHTHLHTACISSSVHSYNTRLSPELLPEHLLAGVTILGEASDTLVELLERHLVVEEGPSEGGLVVDEGDFLLLVRAG